MAFTRTYATELDPTDDATRRRFIGTLGAAGLGVVLAGCADDDPSGAGSDADATRKVEDYFGSVTVPARPKRIVSGDDQTTAALINLGVTPVASYFTGYAERPAYLGEAVTGVKDISDQEREGIVMEDALALDPDLLITIVGTDGEAFLQERYELYKNAVPTFGWMRDYKSLAGHEAGFLAVGSAIGKNDDAKETFAAVNSRVAELKERVGQLSAPPKVVLVQVRADAISTRFWEAVPAVIGGLGLEWALDDPEGGTDLSLEQTRLLNNAEVIFTMKDVDADRTLSDLQTNPLWKGLTAVKAERVHAIDSPAWLATDPMALQIILDDLERLVIEPAEAAS
jgi:iron complex transport system substrate-binding protein